MYPTILQMRGATTANTRYVSTETLRGEVSGLNRLISKYNESVARFLKSFRNRSLYTHAAPSPERYATTLTSAGAGSEIRLANGPYSDLGGTLQVGDARVALPPATARVRTSRPYIESNLFGVVRVQVLTVGSLEEIDVELGGTTGEDVTTTIEVWDPDVAGLVDEHVTTTTQVPNPLTLTAIVEGLSSALFGLASVYADSEGYIYVEGEPGVYCMRLYGNLASAMGFPTKMGSLSSGLFVPTQDVADIVRGEVINTVTHTGPITIEEGSVISPKIEAKSILRLAAGAYVVKAGGELVPYLTLTPASDLSGTYNGQISEEQVRVKGLRGETSSSAELGAYKVVTSPECMLSQGNEGDLILTDGGPVEIVNKRGGTARIARPLPDGEYTAVSPEYLRATALADALELITFSAKAPQSYPEALAAVNDLSALKEKINLSLDDRPTSLKRQMSQAVSKIRASHLNLGLDRAWDTLRVGDLDGYFELTEANASYAGTVRNSLNLLTSRVRSL